MVWIKSSTDFEELGQIKFITFVLLNIIYIRSSILQIQCFKENLSKNIHTKCLMSDTMLHPIQDETNGPQWWKIRAYKNKTTRFGYWVPS